MGQLFLLPPWNHKFLEDRKPIIPISIHLSIFNGHSLSISRVNIILSPCLSVSESGWVISPGLTQFWAQVGRVGGGESINTGGVKDIGSNCTQREQDVVGEGKKHKKTQLNQIHEMTWKGKSYCCNESEFARKDEWCSLSGWVQAADATSTLASQRPSWGWKSDHTPKSDRPKIRLLFTLCAHHTHFIVKIWKDHLPKPLHCSQVPQPTCSRYMSAGEPDYCIVAIWKLGQEQKWRSSYFSPTHKSKLHGFLFCVYAWTSRTNSDIQSKRLTPNKRLNIFKKQNQP